MVNNRSLWAQSEQQQSKKILIRRILLDRAQAWKKLSPKYKFFQAIIYANLELSCKFEHSFNQCNQPEHQTNKTIRTERGGETYVKGLG